MANYNVTTEEGTVTLSNLGKVASYLGVKRISKKDLEDGKYPMVSLAQDEELDLQYKEDFAKEEAKQEEDSFMNDPSMELTDTQEDTALTDTHEEDIKDEEEDTYPDDADNIEDAPEDNSPEYPEVGDFADVKAMKKFIKGLSDESLQEWCILEGATWNPSDHQSINRMRMAMAIKALHFPDTAPKAGKSKKKSKYGHYTTEELVSMALENDISVRDDKGDVRIMRMYTIVALRDAGIIE